MRSTFLKSTSDPIYLPCHFNLEIKVEKESPDNILFNVSHCDEHCTLKENIHRPFFP
ncbi:unnamed protein product [Acanthoscelides obtectus]|uniref:Uncharacterized protein n=1 Tax=Acanthoscelides obtectus TaxID=200917 RepID=A0A9P0MC05_ACAOB|nr:unnamed protein product [Acanthoscelides obtectus]CAK1677630.1 hypothetical protein AOBTE_LOCUS31443 [Acanthoscelides obtectus]